MMVDLRGDDAIFRAAVKRVQAQLKSFARSIHRKRKVHGRHAGSASRPGVR